ncbi:MAG: hypothetical protein ACFFEJ_13015 [Candidatus Thorarchaeota archaeon]
MGAIDTQIDAVLPEFIFIVLLAVVIIWVTILAGALTRMQRYGRLSTALFILAFLAAMGSAISLGIELFFSVILANESPRLTTLLTTLLMFLLGIPSGYIVKHYGEDRVKEEEIARHFDRATNDAFTIGTTLQIIVLTLLTSGVLSADTMADLLSLFSLVVVSPLIIYDLSFFYHIRRHKVHLSQDALLDNQNRSDTGEDS